jgi:glycosyltransferase involved in cell wall biosynthesis
MVKMKRIIFTVSNDLSYDQRMQKICRSLFKAGYSVELVGRQRENSIPLGAEPYKQTRLRCWFDSGKLFYAEYNLRLLVYLLFTKFDAACAIDLDTIVPVYIAGRLKCAKLVYDAHEYFTEVPEVNRRPIVKSVWKWVERVFVPRFDLCYTVSKGLADIFEKEYGKKVNVIMNVPFYDEHGAGVVNGSTRNMNAGSLAVKPFILYQGALNEGRGLEFLIEAMQGIDCELKLAGEGDLSAELRALASKMGLNEKVSFLGYITPAKLKLLTAQATIGVNMLENKGLSYYYSLSNKFFDYIHNRVPQVCIDFPEYRMVNEKYHVALLTKDCTPYEIKQAIIRLLTDTNLYWQLQKNCEVCSRELNWQREEKMLLGLYEQLFR